MEWVTQEFYNETYKKNYETLTDVDLAVFEYLEQKAFNLVDQAVGGLINEIGTDQILDTIVGLNKIEKKAEGYYLKMAISAQIAYWLENEQFHEINASKTLSNSTFNYSESGTGEETVFDLLAKEAIMYLEQSGLIKKNEWNGYDVNRPEVIFNDEGIIFPDIVIGGQFADTADTNLHTTDIPMGPWTTEYPDTNVTDQIKKLENATLENSNTTTDNISDNSIKGLGRNLTTTLNNRDIERRKNANDIQLLRASLESAGGGASIESTVPQNNIPNGNNVILFDNVIRDTSPSPVIDGWSDIANNALRIPTEIATENLVSIRLRCAITFDDTVGPNDLVATLDLYRNGALFQKGVNIDLNNQIPTPQTRLFEVYITEGDQLPEILPGDSFTAVLNKSGGDISILEARAELAVVQTIGTLYNIEDLNNVDNAIVPTNNDILVYNELMGKYEPKSYTIETLPDNDIKLDGTQADRMLSVSEDGLSITTKQLSVSDLKEGFELDANSAGKVLAVDTSGETIIPATLPGLRIAELHLRGTSQTVTPTPARISFPTIISDTTNSLYTINADSFRYNRRRPTGNTKLVMNFSRFDIDSIADVADVVIKLFLNDVEQGSRSFQLFKENFQIIDLNYRFENRTQSDLVYFTIESTDPYTQMNSVDVYNTYVAKSGGITTFSAIEECGVEDQFLNPSNFQFALNTILNGMSRSSDKLSATLQQIVNFTRYPNLHGAISTEVPATSLHDLSLKIEVAGDGVEPVQSQGHWVEVINNDTGLSYKGIYTNNTWNGFVATEIEDTPIDGFNYVRRDGAWRKVATIDVTETLATTTLAERMNDPDIGTIYRANDLRYTAGYVSYDDEVGTTPRIIWVFNNGFAQPAFQGASGTTYTVTYKKKVYQ